MWQIKQHQHCIKQSQYACQYGYITKGQQHNTNHLIFNFGIFSRFFTGKGLFSSLTNARYIKKHLTVS